MIRIGLTMIVLCTVAAMAVSGRSEQPPTDTAPQAAAEGKSQYDFLPPDTGMVFFVRPGKVLDSKVVLSFVENRRELLVDGAKENMNVDPTNIEEITSFLVVPKEFPPVNPRGNRNFEGRKVVPKEDALKEEENFKDAVKKGDCDEEEAEETPEEKEYQNPMGTRLKLRTATPVKEAREMLAKMEGRSADDEEDVSEVTYQGQKYLQVKQYFTTKFGKKKVRHLSQVIAFLKLADDEYVQGSEWVIKRIIDKGNRPSPVAKLASELPSTAPMGMAASLEGQDKFRRYLKKFLKRGDIPAQVVAMVRNMPDQVQHVQAYLELDGKEKSPLLNLAFTGVDDKASEELEQLAKQTVGMAQFLGMMAMAEMKEPEFKPLVNTAGKTLRGLNASRTGRVVNITVPNPGNLIETAKQMRPLVIAARGAARKSTAKNNMKQLMLGFHNYHNVYQEFLPSRLAPKEQFEKDGKPLLSWRVPLLPYLDYSPLYEKFKITERWSSENNKPLASPMPEVFKYPGIETGDKTVFRMFLTPPGGKGGVTTFIYGHNNPTRIRDITDGTSNTIMIVQVGADKATPWTDPTPLKFDPKDPVANKKQLGKLPGKTFLVAMADGSVQELPVDISPENFTALLTINGGEIVDWDDLVNTKPRGFGDAPPRKFDGDRKDTTKE